jgi:hypothetical protein
LSHLKTGNYPANLFPFGCHVSGVVSAARR